MRIARKLPLLGLVLVAVLHGCGDSSSPRIPDSISAAGSASISGTVGQALTQGPRVVVLDASGAPVRGITVVFTVAIGGGSLRSSTSVTGSNGEAASPEWTLGTVAGIQSLTATVEGLTPIFLNATATAGPAERLVFAAQPGSVVAGGFFSPSLRVLVQDGFGNTVLTSSAPITVSFLANPAGAVLSGAATLNASSGVATFSSLSINVVSPGYALRATSPGLDTATTEVFSVLVDPPAPAISGILPAILTPGAVATITGLNFDTNAAGNQVDINGFPSVVVGATSTTLQVVVPQIATDCDPTRNVPVTIITNGKSAFRLHPAQTAPQLTLAPGESRVLTSAAAARCVELPPGGGRYLISVFSAISDTNTAPGVQYALRGKPSLIPQSAVIAAEAITAPAPRIPSSRPAVGIDPIGASLLRAQQRAQDSTHDAILRRNAEIIEEQRRVRSAARSGQIASDMPPPSMAPAAVATVGSINEFRYSSSSCVDYVPIHARTVWVGQHAIIVEDTASFPSGPARLNGTFDAKYVAIGEEFDQVMWPIVTANFGNPLVVDSRMAQHGKIIMLFTPRVNNINAQAFVFSCDFYPRSGGVPKSNEAAIFYSRVPTSSAPGTSSNTSIDHWFWITRSTVIHETKHIAAYAERIGNFGAVETPFLEEGGARIAEEMYARSFYLNGWKDNSLYASTIYCDYRPEAAECAGSPYLIRKHFEALTQYMANSEIRTVLGNIPGDATYYGSAWSLLRWSADHFSADEGQFFRAMTQAATQTGAANLESRTGRSWTELFGEWTLSLAADDLAGFTPLNSRIRFPGWNLRDLFKFLNQDFPFNGYPNPYPLIPRPVGFADFIVANFSVLRGGFSMYELSGASAGSQIVELQNIQPGLPVPADLRMSLLRIN